MQFTELTIPGLQRIDLECIEDDRGFFARLFCCNEAEAAGLTTRIVQCNNTLTRTVGSIRGIHFQRPPMAETKIIRCLRGAVFDVAVDLRAGSETFGCWSAIELNENNRSMVYIPQGFGHGFQTLAPDTELLYFHSEFYSKPDEGGLDPLDSELAIEWPLPVADMSDRDRQHPALSEFEAIVL